MKRFKADIVPPAKKVPKSNSEPPKKRPKKKAKTKPKLSPLNRILNTAERNSAKRIQCPVCGEPTLGSDLLLHMLDSHEKTVSTERLSTRLNNLISIIRSKHGRKAYSDLVNKAKKAKQNRRFRRIAREDKKRSGGVLDPDSVRSAPGNVSYATPKRQR